MISDLRVITTFVRTAELGNLSKAAEAQQISPQAASKALAQERPARRSTNTIGTSTTRSPLRSAR